MNTPNTPNTPTTRTTPTTPTTRNERTPLSRDRILTTAVAMADEHGVEGLSMRKLAKELDYEVMSLYNHVANKDDLLDGMADTVAGGIALPAEDLPWKRAVREIAVSWHEALVRHRWAAAMLSQRWPGPNRWRHMDNLLRLLSTADLPDDVADLGFHAITMHIQGFTQQQIAYSAVVPDEEAMLERFRAEVSPEVFPHIVAHVRYHGETDGPLDEFGFVLDLILDGLERAAAEG